MKLRESSPWIQVEYVRSFSALGKLQKAHSVRYRLRQESDCCQLSLEQTEPDAHVRSEKMLLYCSGEAGHKMLVFLYENAVHMENWKELVTELLPEGVIGE